MAKSDDRETGTLSSPISAERFARVRAIFESALERQAAERRAFAAGACGPDRDLLREVEAMLAAEGQFDGVLDRPPSPSSSLEEGRFPAGMVLAGRYRILALLGKGGMGEVYKAFDLILNQIVALKFLAPSSISEGALIRFRNEVRIARQVSHPNVCRVYDLGMADGLHFLSMEYIDGEDLASLLRRIGRLPQDKGVEFTRKICAGLGAAHERGVLHRDLKPSNIMIDGRGHVRITDFGLAAFAAEIPLSDMRSGTPAYMSPEQKAGKDVTTRSDLYSLGLVLHEMFTGKRPGDSQLTPGSRAKDLDPAIERLILRCLEEDPKRRPQTALSVAMALPGGDPIAAALAAGETPSPEMVAASQEKEGFSVSTAVLCLGAVVVCLIGGIMLASKTGLLARAPLPLPPDALADRAQTLLRTLGYTEEPDTTTYGFFCCNVQAISNLKQYGAAQREEVLLSHQPPIIGFFYRQQGKQSSGRRTSNPFPDILSRETGITRLILNPKGTLVRLEAQQEAEPANFSGVDWSVLFSAAGLDATRFTSATPEMAPRVPTDARVAWTGTYAQDRKEQIRVEAASWQGRPAMFDVQAFPSETPAQTSLLEGLGLATNTLLVLFAASAVFTAWRNVRLGRSDTRGAAVIAAASVLTSAGAWLLDPAYVERSFGLWTSLIVLCILYIAIEPYARRNWPDSLISWTRLCNGKVGNPLVASHLLVGIVAGEAFALLVHPGMEAFALLPELSVRIGASGFGSAANATGVWLTSARYGLAFGLFFLLMVVILRLLLRRMWLADVVGSLLMAFILGGPPGTLGFRSVFLLILATCSLVCMWLLRRFGFLTMTTLWIVASAGITWPLTITGWLAGRSIAFHLIPIIVAAWALWVIASDVRRPSTDWLGSPENA